MVGALKARYTLIDNETMEQVGLPGIEPTEGLPGIDISGDILVNGKWEKGGLRKLFGCEVFDQASGNSANCKSAITYIDGDKGILRHRGYDIQDLTENCDYMDVSHLLLDGELPTQEQRTAFESQMVKDMNLSDTVLKVIGSHAGNPTKKPMAILASAVSAAAGEGDGSNPRRMIGQMAAIAAHIIRMKQGKNSVIAPIEGLGFSENFVTMAFSDDDYRYVCNPVVAEAMDKLLILHADHEQNASTTAVRTAQSARQQDEAAEVAPALTAGVVTLAGSLHGGANQEVLEQLNELANTDTDLPLDDRIDRIIARAKDKDDPFRLMGFGHRVYKNFDPRALVLKQFVDTLLSTMGIQDERLDIAMKLEERALADPYFQGKKLFPNVDFYSGIAMAAMGLEPELFTLIFAVGRTSGWIAQAEEQTASKQAINRPRQMYMGETKRSVIAPV